MSVTWQQGAFDIYSFYSFYCPWDDKPLHVNMRLRLPRKFPWFPDLKSTVYWRCCQLCLVCCQFVLPFTQRVVLRGAPSSMAATVVQAQTCLRRTGALFFQHVAFPPAAWPPVEDRPPEQLPEGLLLQGLRYLNLDGQGIVDLPGSSWKELSSSFARSASECDLQEDHSLELGRQ
eukprot:3326090-Amphidinium_carterae.1